MIAKERLLDSRFDLVNPGVVVVCNDHYSSGWDYSYVQRFEIKRAVGLSFSQTSPHVNEI